MESDRREQLLNLKQKILASLAPLVLEGDAEPEERLEAALALIDLGNASTALYAKAVDTAGDIQDVTLRTDYLMKLLGAVQSDLSNSVAVNELPIEQGHQQNEQEEGLSGHSEEPAQH